MSILVYAFAAFFSALLVHFVVWRIALPSKQTTVLLKIFFGVFIACVVFYAAVFTKVFFGIFSPRDYFAFIRFFLLYAVLTLAYIISYSAIEADSPSLIIIRRIHKAGLTGLPLNGLKEELNDQVLVVPRIHDLARDGLIFCEEGKYRLTRKGNNFITIFIFFRRCLKAQKGG